MTDIVETAKEVETVVDEGREAYEGITKFVKDLYSLEQSLQANGLSFLSLVSDITRKYHGVTLPPPAPNDEKKSA